MLGSEVSMPTNLTRKYTTSTSASHQVIKFPDILENDAIIFNLKVNIEIDLTITDRYYI